MILTTILGFGLAAQVGASPMSSPSADQTPSSLTGPCRDEIVAALERREVELSPEEVKELEYEHERDTRQAFRRMIDPGIMRGTDHNTALASMKVLLKLAENLLSDPDNIKYRQFKPTNNVIKKNLIDVKGAMEYAVAMGFRADVQNFQPYYVFNQTFSKELRIGAAVLQEALTREVEKEERAQKMKQEEKNLKQLQAQQIKLAFQDDRRRRALHDKLEKERRDARSSAVPAEPLQSPPTSPTIASSTSPGRTLAEPNDSDTE